MNVYLIKEESWCEYGNVEHRIYPLYDNENSAVNLAKYIIKNIKETNLEKDAIKGTDYKEYLNQFGSGDVYDWCMDVIRDDEIFMSFCIQVLNLPVNEYSFKSDTQDVVEFNQFI